MGFEAHRVEVRKHFRHTGYSNVSYLDLPVTFNGSKKAGEFFLYGESELELIRQILNSVKHSKT